MRSIRYRLLFLFLLAFVIWFCYLSVNKPVSSNLTRLMVPPRGEITQSNRREQFVYQDDSLLSSLDRTRIERSADQLTFPAGNGQKRSTNSWFEPTILLREDMGNSKDQKKCSIPQINPFHDLAMKEMQDVGVIKCPKEEFGHVVNGSLILKAWKLRYAHIQYIQRPPENDDGYALSDPIQLIQPIKDHIRPGNLGCLVAGKKRILEFEDDFNVIDSNDCTPDAFLGLQHDGTIRNLHGKILSIQECSSERCSLTLSLARENASTRFIFENNGQIKHKDSLKCLVFMPDEFDNFNELILSKDCQHPAAWWTMYHYPENDVVLEKPLTGDFVRLLLVHQLECQIEYHAIVVPTTIDLQQDEKLQSQSIPNVALIVLESQSAANVERKMPRFFHHLKNARNAFIFKGHSIVGDGTTDQLCAMLVGQLEKHLPIALKSSLNSVFVDEWRFIFRDFRERGYVTLFTEDDSRFPAFSYRLNGFKIPPTDHYARNFWQCATLGNKGKNFCIGRKPYHKVSLDYTESLFDAYDKKPKFSVTILSAESHNNLNNIQYMEDDLIQFLINMKTKGHLYDTFVFIVGDHGLRASAFRASFTGWLEERLPFFALLVPDAYFGGNVNIRRAIHQNTQHLTSHFDIYATLCDILDAYVKFNSTVGHSLLKPIDRANRTCKSAGIGHHWCPCKSFSLPDSLAMQQEDVALAVVGYINELLTSVAPKLKCAELVLQDIKYASHTARTTHDLVGGSFNLTDYLIVLSVLPSNGIFEASVTRQHSGAMVVDPNISRLDLYGNQSLCIIRDHPNLRKFCYCSEFL